MGLVELFKRALNETGSLVSVSDSNCSLKEISITHEINSDKLSLTSVFCVSLNRITCSES